MGTEAVGLFALALKGCVIAVGLVNLRQPTVRLGIAWAGLGGLQKVLARLRCLLRFDTPPGENRGRRLQIVRNVARACLCPQGFVTQGAQTFTTRTRTRLGGTW